MSQRGQTVHIKGSGGGAHFASMDDANQDAHQTVAVSNTVGVLMDHALVDTDGFITASGEFTVPAATGHGIYRVGIWGRLAQGSGSLPSTGYIRLLFENGGGDHNRIQQVDVPNAGIEIDELHIVADWELDTGYTVLAEIDNETDVEVKIRHSFVVSDVVWRMTIEFVGPIP